ncbi:Abscisic acid 8'-hydroxylase 3-like protein [Cladobotryum mycophilum]|uniref:Abscisic acid 8'-hydroxylase 3-like protein n=1 Tax=Cladobotryum mycophilum TaxID=491253 RepID=A0ABR0T3Q2_9HYPO
MSFNADDVLTPRQVIQAPSTSVCTPDGEILKTPVESMLNALREHGPIIGIKRNGRKQYIVSKEYTHKVLTDDSSFSFEHGMGKFLGLSWIYRLRGGAFSSDMDSLVRDFLIRRLDVITPKIWPIFEEGAAKVAKAARPAKEYENENISKCVVHLAEDMAELTGLFQNQYFLARNVAWLWRPLNWAKVILFRFPLHVGPTIARQLWADISRHKDPFKSKEETLVAFLVHRYASADGYVSFDSKLWIIALIVTVIFTSVHQTVTIMMWVTFYLALHPESQQAIRKEYGSVIESDGTNSSGPSASLQSMDAVVTDSFVREILRMKGDPLNVVRWTVKDVEMGGYTIPKDYFVFPVTYLSKRSTEFISNPHELDPNRWLEGGKTAATTGPGYLSFGIGKWPCPGRIFAVLEIRSWILALVKATRFELDGGKYHIVDPLNITSVAPRRLLIEECKDTL